MLWNVSLLCYTSKVVTVISAVCEKAADGEAQGLLLSCEQAQEQLMPAKLLLVYNFQKFYSDWISTWHSDEDIISCKNKKKQTGVLRDGLKMGTGNAMVTEEI